MTRDEPGVEELTVASCSALLHLNHEPAARSISVQAAYMLRAKKLLQAPGWVAIICRGRTLDVKWPAKFFV